MYTRQATRLCVGLSLLLGACSAPATPPPHPAATATIEATSTPTATTVPPTATPLGCLGKPGRVEPGVLETTKPPQQYLIYLPPCYDEQTSKRYPVLYLLHGQTYIDDQWVRLGAPQAADRLILSGEAEPFIMVFPDDRYWNVDAGPGFGERLIDHLIPYVDSTYRTLRDRSHRALGGLSRGGDWTIRLGLAHPGLFGQLGLHSPGISPEAMAEAKDSIAGISAVSLPRLWLDVGDQDSQLGYAQLFESLLAEHEVAHEFHLYAGDHSEVYWKQHVEEYLRWYVGGWRDG
jgi:enterochelin esterase-like enzyme